MKLHCVNSLRFFSPRSNNPGPNKSRGCVANCARLAWTSSRNALPVTRHGLGAKIISFIVIVVFQSKSKTSPALPRSAAHVRPFFNDSGKYCFVWPLFKIKKIKKAVSCRQGSALPLRVLQPCVLNEHFYRRSRTVCCVGCAAYSGCCSLPEQARTKSSIVGYIRQKSCLVLAMFYLKQKMACAGWLKPLVFNRAENEARTRDPQIGKLAALLRVWFGSLPSVAVRVTYRRKSRYFLPIRLQGISPFNARAYRVPSPMPRNAAACSTFIAESSPLSRRPCR